MGYRVICKFAQQNQLAFIVGLCHNNNVAIASYKNKATRDIALGRNSKESRKALPAVLHIVARKRLAFLAAVESLNDLKARSGLGLHSLKADRKGQYAIIINDQYRICFLWDGRNAEAVEIVDYH